MHRLQHKQPWTSLGYTGQVKTRVLCRTQKIIKRNLKQFVIGILSGGYSIGRILKKGKNLLQNLVYKFITQQETLYSIKKLSLPLQSE